MIEARAARLTGELAERADGEGLVDVAVAREDSPFGELLLAATDAGLVTVVLPGADIDERLEGLAAAISPRVLEAPARLEPVRRQLDAYFAGRLRDFDLPLDRRLSAGFMRSALDVIAAIPYGETFSYAEVAARAGSPRAHRAAGTACATNPIPIVVPCHRVLATGGRLGGYGGGLEMKRALLRLEGVG